MRLYHFTTRGEVELMAEDGWRETTLMFPWRGQSRSGVALADSTLADDYDETSCWLVVVEIDEREIVAFERSLPTPLRRVVGALMRRRCPREWLVPATVMDVHARVVEIGNYSDTEFAARHPQRFA